MRVVVRSLGPLKDSEIELGDLTVLYGPAGEGKSLLMKRIFGEYLILNDVFKEVISCSISLQIARSLKGGLRARDALVMADVIDEILRIKDNWIKKWVIGGELEFSKTLEDLLSELELDFKEQIEGEGWRVIIEGKERMIRVEAEGVEDPSKLMDVLKATVKVTKEKVRDLLEEASRKAKGEIGVERITYSHYGRGALVQMLYSLEECKSLRKMDVEECVRKIISFEDFEPLKRPLSLSLPLVTALESYEAINDSTLGKLFEAFSLPGNEEFLKASALAQSLMAMRTQLCRYGNASSLIFIEEPEEEMGKRRQVRLASLLYSIACYLKRRGAKLVIATQSSAIVLTLAYLSALKATVEDAMRFCNLQPKEIEDLKCETPQVKFYRVEKGKVRLTSLSDVIEDMGGFEELTPLTSGL
ncbi:hypothetical protein IPA_06245 [Ignicoccus pacificus DSM 13166]|uniref:ATPase AAA-type core domain-containing protein n=1 Tax=Ignicoccus pacificus DSM 13166 TaxID=940294 RepID=A0A977PL19_9CREN|nr:hypothetical protein IPA_06245 [Ignicoccus pacificus DSM 13166]